jgi:hypothetical protein
MRPTQRYQILPSEFCDEQYHNQNTECHQGKGVGERVQKGQSSRNNGKGDSYIAESSPGISRLLNTLKFN